MNHNRILITGGSGFIGTNLVENFLSQGCEVMNVDIAPPRNKAHAPQWRKVDILDRSLLLKEVQAFSPEVLLHFAARTDLDEKHNLDGYAANIEGVCHLVEAVRLTPSIERAVFASSQLVCKLGYQPKDEHDYFPTTLYGRSKVLTEKIIRTAHDFDAAWTIVRPTSIWGPWFDIPYKNFFIAIANNRYVHPGTLKTLKQWGYVGNVVYQVQRLLGAAPAQIHARTFYLADHDPLELRCFADCVQAAFKARPIPSVPVALLKTVASIGDVFQKLGWHSVPLTSFRLCNIITSEVVDVGDLRVIAGPLPYTVQEGVLETLRWMHNCVGLV